jgi:hypothetical protein
MRDSEFGHWTFGVKHFVFRRNRARADYEQEESGERLSPKKLPPPTPDRREGRLFPPEQS